MGCTVTQESFQGLTSYWTDASLGLKWGSVFVLPSWLEVWWQAFQPSSELHLAVVSRDGETIGIAPLHLRGGTAAFVGSADVCDYLDFVVVPGKEEDFFHNLLEDLRSRNVERMHLESLRADSSAFVYLTEIARRRGCTVRTEEVDVSLSMELPATWEDYLASLIKKQRHEVRRKLRRLREADSVDYRCLPVRPVETGELTDRFLELFVRSREEKADFMTEKMESFFRAVARSMAEIGILRYGILELESSPVAMIMAFDYNQTRYLYNSAFQPRYDSLSIGLLSKVLGIQQSIDAGLKYWDFLKGAEEYKSQLGGREIKLYNCWIDLS